MLKRMDLPPALRHLTEIALEGVSLTELTRAAGTLSRRYRAEVQDGRLHLADALVHRPRDPSSADVTLDVGETECLNRKLPSWN